MKNFLSSLLVVFTMFGVNLAVADYKVQLIAPYYSCLSTFLSVLVQVDATLPSPEGGGGLQ